MGEIKINITIAIVTALLTWLVNWLTIRGEIKKTKKEKINESRSLLYTECYGLLERNITNSNIVFDHEYIKELIAAKPKMKLIASNNVLKVYEKYFKWAIGIYRDYTNYCKEKDPTEHYEIVTAPDGTEYEIPVLNEYDLEYYNMLTKRYIEDRNIDERTVKSKLQDILNAMRKDLGNDTYRENSIN